MGHNCYIGGWTSTEVNCATVVILNFNTPILEQFRQPFTPFRKLLDNFPDEQIKFIRNIKKFNTQTKLHFYKGTVARVFWPLVFS